MRVGVVWLCFLSTLLPAYAFASDAADAGNVGHYSASDPRREENADFAPPNSFLFETPAAPKDATNDERLCLQTPAFITALHQRDLAAYISDHVSGRMKPYVLMKSSERSSDAQSRSGGAGILHAAEPPFGTCLSQCVRLPQYARATRISLSAADGRSKCGYLPSKEFPRFEQPVIDCGDGSRWADVVAWPVNGEWLVCATVINTRQVRSRHRLTVSYEYNVQQIG